MVPSQRLLGFERFNLHNMIHDPSMMSEELAYGMFRDAGLPASRTGFAWLEINGSTYGLYSLIETVDDDFLDDRFESGDGNLYEDGENSCDFDWPSCFEAEEFDEKSGQGNLYAFYQKWTGVFRI